jgi:hypothetical protein
MIRSLKIMLVIAVFWIGLFATPICADKWNIFTDPSDGVAFNYPSDWVVLPQRTHAFRVMVGPVGGVTNCTLGTRVVPQLKNISAEEMVRSTSKQDIINGAKQSGTDLIITDFFITKIGNRDALYYEGDSCYQSMNTNIAIRSINVMTKVDDKIYLLSCSSSNQQEMINNKSIYQSILSSLTIRF